MQYNQRRYFLVLLGSLWSVSTPIALAYDGNGLTPNQPSSDASVLLSRNVSQKTSREYTFKAPDSKTLGSSSQLAAVQSYQVQVYGSSPDLLSQVRKIEPTAFIKEDLIQVGIFKQQHNAEAVVRKLVNAGMWARIISN